MVSGRLIVVLALASVIAPTNGQSLLSLLPPQLQSLLPSSALPPLAQLTPKDIQVVQAIAQQFPSFSSIQQLLQTLELNSPALASLLDQAIAQGKTLLAETEAMLTPQTQQFLQQLLGIGQSAAQQGLQLAQSQPPAVTANLQSTFPNLASLASTPVAQQTLPLLLPS
ncbi:unnamed protein product [Bursaphelenchus okinawaensis]|uniref:DUF148 domain-containing protein n=1 Tax=Bursaphelenchus okinawaensis TaxID=465554 RepID=A0A811L3C3_9BILA|nr:unnamed protein product [Bursaphelenchus okinawaensis]CAG9116568.1 unnamed protein product [Bursaphelenchus okinawaensis]